MDIWIWKKKLPCIYNFFKYALDKRIVEFVLSAWEEGRNFIDDRRAVLI